MEHRNGNSSSATRTDFVAAHGAAGYGNAFEVLSKARALERTGRNIVHLEIGEPDFSTPPHIVEAAVDALRGGGRIMAPRPGCPNCARPSPTTSAARAAFRSSPTKWSWFRRKPSCSTSCSHSSMRATSDLSNPVFHLRVDDPLRRRHAHPIPLREERDFAMDVMRWQA